MSKDGPSRKDPLYAAFKLIHPKRILEFGVCPGKNALYMIGEAQRHTAKKSDVQYYGFDLFAPMTTQEFDDTHPAPLDWMQAKLDATGAEVHLFRGDSKLTFPGFAKTAEPMDFIYIDGGHSRETISSDWEHSKRLLKPGTILIFDDYWDRLDGGCRAVVDAIDRNKYSVEICEPGELFPGDWRLAPSYLCRAVKVMVKV